MRVNLQQGQRVVVTADGPSDGWLLVDLPGVGQQYVPGNYVAHT